MKPSLMKKVVFAIAGVLLLFIASTLFTGGSGKPKSKRPASSEEVQSGTVEGIPGVTAAEFTFPNLPHGMYVGTMHGFIPGHQLPLTLISLPDQGGLAVILGIPGWTPKLVPIPEAAAPANGEPVTQAIRIASNGVILEMTGQAVDGSLTGFFRNIITGEEGRWDAAAVRGEE